MTSIKPGSLAGGFAPVVGLLSSLLLSLLLASPARAQGSKDAAVEPPPPPVPPAVPPPSPPPVPVAPLALVLPPYPAPLLVIQVPPPSLDPSVRKLLEAGMASEDGDAVSALVKFAIQTNPYDKDEIQRMNRAFQDRRARALAAKTKAEERRIRQAGLLQLWKGQVELGASRATGNSQTAGISGSLKLDRKGIDWQHTITGSVNYLEDSGTVSQNKYNLSYQPRYTLSDKLYTYANALFESDRIQGYRQRYSLSGGLGKRLITSRDMNLSLQIGPAIRRAIYVSDPAETTWSGSGSLDFDWAFGKGLKLTQNASAYIGSDNSTFTSTTGIETGINRHLTAKVTYAFEHETDPPDDAIETDTNTRFTLVYRF